MGDCKGPAGTELIDCKGLRITPGLIDLHFQGIMGHDVWEMSAEAMRAISTELSRFGVTSFLVTTAFYGGEKLARQVELVGEESLYAGAGALGVYLESPFISAAKRGGIPEDVVSRPSVEALGEIIEAARGKLRMMTVAPEAPGNVEVIEELVKNGIVAAIGHTNATYEETVRAIEAGARHATHLFNAMSGMHQREPGAATAALLDERVTVEQILDGIHVHPAMVELAVRLKGPERVVIITDAVKAAGLSDGDYVYGDRKRTVRVRDGAPRLEDGRLAGSSLTMDRAVRNMMEKVGRSAGEAVRMATTTPAEVLGLGGRKGRVAAGYDADLTVFDEEWSVRATMVSGRIVYRA